MLLSKCIELITISLSGGRQFSFLEKDKEARNHITQPFAELHLITPWVVVCYTGHLAISGKEKIAVLQQGAVSPGKVRAAHKEVLCCTPTSCKRSCAAHPPHATVTKLFALPFVCLPTHLPLNNTPPPPCVTVASLWYQLQATIVGAMVMLTSWLSGTR